MSDVINKTTLVEKFSVNSPDYPTTEWIHNPDKTLVQGVPKKYWKISNDTLVEMTQSEKDAVDAAIYASTIKPKIVNLMSNGLEKKDFKAVNYKTELKQTLYPKRYFNAGELYKVEWFSDSTLTDKILDVDINYTRDLFNNATERTTTRTWMNTDNNPNTDIKTTIKYYDSIAAMAEAQRRRKNILDQLKLETLGYMVATMPTEQGISDPLEIESVGITFLATFISNSSAYVDSGSLDFKTDIQNATDAWLDNIIPNNPGVTIRDNILAQIV